MKRALTFDIDAAWCLTLFLMLLAAMILRRFVEPLLWASITAIATWPIYQRFAQLLRSSTTSNGVALVFTMLVSLFVLGPIVFAFGAVVLQAQSWVDQVVLADKTGLAIPAWLETWPLVGTELAERWQTLLGAPGGVSVWLKRADTSAVLGWAQTLAQFTGHHLFIIVFTILVLFFLYRAGDSLAYGLHRLLRDRSGERAESYVELAVVALRATVNGMVVVGIFDGVLTAITYALAGMQHAAVWGALTGLFSMIPFLGYVAVAGAAVALAARGAGMGALAVAALGVIVLFAGDKIVRTVVIGKAARLGFVWVLMGSLGGFELLGLLGLFVGPVVLALAAALWHEWTECRQLRRAATRSTLAGAPTKASAADPIA